MGARHSSSFMLMQTLEKSGKSVQSRHCLHVHCRSIQGLKGLLVETSHIFFHEFFQFSASTSEGEYTSALYSLPFHLSFLKAGALKSDCQHRPTSLLCLVCDLQSFFFFTPLDLFSHLNSGEADRILSWGFQVDTVSSYMERAWLKTPHILGWVTLLYSRN